MKSNINPSLDVTEKNWVLSFGRSDLHGLIIAEGIKPKGEYFIEVYDFVPKGGLGYPPYDYLLREGGLGYPPYDYLLRDRGNKILYERIYGGGIPIGAIPGVYPGKVRILSIEDFAVSEVKTSCIVSSEKGQEMREAILESQRKPPPFCLPGKGNFISRVGCWFGSFFSSTQLDRCGCHNCTTWAISMLKIAGIGLSQGYVPGPEGATVDSGCLHSSPNA